jgi:hypothetical protein
VYRQVDLAVNERILELFYKQSLIADFRQGGVKDLIPFGFYDLQFNIKGFIQRYQETFYCLGLKQRQLRSTGSDYNLQFYYSKLKNSLTNFR